MSFYSLHFYIKRTSMKKLLCGLLLGWSSCLFSVDIKEVLATINTKDFKKNALLKQIVQLVAPNASYQNYRSYPVATSSIKKAHAISNHEGMQPVSEEYNFEMRNNSQITVNIITEAEKNFVIEAVGALTKNITADAIEYVAKVFKNCFSDIRNNKLQIWLTDNLEALREDGILYDYCFNHNLALLKVFCGTLFVVFNLRQSCLNEDADHKTLIEKVKFYLVKNFTKDEFESFDIGYCIYESFNSSFEPRPSLLPKDVTDFLEESPNGDFYPIYSSDKFGSSLLSGNNRRTPTVSSSLQIAKVACGSAVVGTGVYALLETEKGNSLIRWMQKNPKKTGLIATMIAAPFLASVV